MVLNEERVCFKTGIDNNPLKTTNQGLTLS